MSRNGIGIVEVGFHNLNEGDKVLINTGTFKGRVGKISILHPSNVSYNLKEAISFTWDNGSEWFCVPFESIGNGIVLKEWSNATM